MKDIARTKGNMADQVGLSEERARKRVPGCANLRDFHGHLRWHDERGWALIFEDDDCLQTCQSIDCGRVDSGALWNGFFQG